MTLRRSPRKAVSIKSFVSSSQHGSEASRERKVKIRIPQKRLKAVKLAAATSLVVAASSSDALPRCMALTESPYFSLESPSRSSPTALSSSENGSSSDNEKRTTSFEPVWTGRFPSLNGQNIRPHTLILGTHPSIASLTANQYYGHPLNAFWWIAGDCLGFRRDSGISPSTGNPYRLASQLRYSESHVIPYEEQLRRLVSKGFALWDVVHSCERKGSLDVDIQKEVPNDIEGFCRQHPSIRRIVLANGGTGSTLFKKHFQSWFESGQLRAGTDESSQRAFGGITKKFSKNSETLSGGAANKITCVSAMSVSPAAAKFTYEQKRDFWDEHVYTPGLLDLEQSTSSSS